MPYEIGIRILDDLTDVTKVTYMTDTKVEKELTLTDGEAKIMLYHSGKYDVVFKAWDELGNESTLTIPVELARGNGGGATKPNSGSGTVRRKRLMKMDGTLARNEWVFKNGFWYYGDADGYTHIGWLLDASGHWYYLDTDGKNGDRLEIRERKVVLSGCGRKNGDRLEIRKRKVVLSE